MTVEMHVRREGAWFPPYFDPLTQVTALHAVWAEDPDWVNPGDGLAVASWRNGPGGVNLTNGTGSAQPLYRASTAALNNRATVQFDGTNDRLVANIADEAQPVKILLVAAYTASSALGKSLIGTGASAGSGIGHAATTGVWYMANSTTLSSAVARDTTGHVLRATLDGASSQLWLDEVSIASGDVGAAAMPELILGSGGTIAVAADSRASAAHIAFCGVYDGATSDVDLAALAADLMSHYGIA